MSTSFSIVAASGETVATTDSLGEALNAALDLPSEFRPYQILSAANLAAARRASQAPEVVWIDGIPVRTDV